MKKSISQWSFPGDWELKRCMKSAKDAGFQAIELAVAEEGEITPESKRGDIERLKTQANDIGINISSLATGLFWKYSLTSSNPDTAEKAQEILIKMLDIASWLGTDAILVVIGTVGADFIPGCEIVPYNESYERSMKLLKKLSGEAEKRKVTICVENVWNKFLLSPLEMKAFIDDIGSPYVQSYFDVGNVLLTGYPEHWIRILGKRIKRVHFKDFRKSVGNINGFVDLLEGDVNWKEVMKAFKEIGYDGYATAEMMPPYPHAPEALIRNTSLAMDYILK